MNSSQLLIVVIVVAVIAVAIIAYAAMRKRRSRHLWGSGHGSFRTRGRYASATVRGTVWLQKDTCSGTLTVVRRGVVTVKDFVRFEVGQS